VFVVDKLFLMVLKQLIFYRINLTCTECLSLTDQNVKFAGNYTSSQSVDCESLFNDIGACCNGRGGCEYISRTECDNIGGIFQGRSVSCYGCLWFCNMFFWYWAVLSEWSVPQNSHILIVSLIMDTI
jgi:hypothetical protein